MSKYEIVIPRSLAFIFRLSLGFSISLTWLGLWTCLLGAKPHKILPLLVSLTPCQTRTEGGRPDGSHYCLLSRRHRRSATGPHSCRAARAVPPSSCPALTASVTLCSQSSKSRPFLWTRKKKDDLHPAKKGILSQCHVQWKGWQEQQWNLCVEKLFKAYLPKTVI